MAPHLGALTDAQKVGHQYTLAGTVFAPDVQHLKQESSKEASFKSLFSLGVTVDGCVVLYAVVCLPSYLLTCLSKFGTALGPPRNKAN